MFAKITFFLKTISGPSYFALLIIVEFFPTSEGHPHVGRLWTKLSPISPLRPGLAVTILALITDSLVLVWWLLCVIPLSRIKSVSATGSKFSNSGGCNLVCCFGFPRIQSFESWVAVLSVACLLTNNPTPFI